MRVGRAPIDEEAIRLIEEHNPDVQFDWTRILKQPTTPQAPESHRSSDSRGGGRERPGDASNTGKPLGAEAPVSATAAVTSVQLPVSSGSESVGVPAEESVELSDTVEPPEPGEPGEPEPLATGNWQLATEIEPRYARLGAEGLARLRARYAEVMARIAEKPLEDAAREELRTKAERLNPDAWVTADEVAAALEQYESVFEQLRTVVGRQPRRRRRGRV